MSFIPEELQYCAFYGSMIGCQMGIKCRFNHGNPNSVPLCPFGHQCKFIQNCKFRHFDFPPAMYPVLPPTNPAASTIHHSLTINASQTHSLTNHTQLTQPTQPTQPTHSDINNNNNNNNNNNYNDKELTVNDQKTTAPSAPPDMIVNPLNHTQVINNNYNSYQPSYHHNKINKSFNPQTALTAVPIIFTEKRIFRNCPDIFTINALDILQCNISLVYNAKHILSNYGIKFMGIKTNNVSRFKIKYCEYSFKYSLNTISYYYICPFNKNIIISGRLLFNESIKKLSILRCNAKIINQIFNELFKININQIKFKLIRIKSKSNNEYSKKFKVRIINANDNVILLPFKPYNIRLGISHKNVFTASQIQRKLIKLIENVCMHISNQFINKNKPKFKKRRLNNDNNNNETRICYTCHQPGHLKRDCKHAGDVCYECGQYGHYARDCNNNNSNALNHDQKQDIKDNNDQKIVKIKTINNNTDVNKETQKQKQTNAKNKRIDCDNIDDIEIKIESCTVPFYHKWDALKIISWISELENGRFIKWMDKLKKIFIEEEVCGTDLKNITIMDLKQFGVTKFSEKKALFQCIQNLTQIEK